MIQIDNKTNSQVCTENFHREDESELEQNNWSKFQGLQLAVQNLNPTFTETSDVRKQSIKGVTIAGTILVVWFVSLALLLSEHIFPNGLSVGIPTDGFGAIALLLTTLVLTAFATIWQTFLYTGLFITAHDSMHGAVFPENPRINNAIGALALICYGLFPYQELLRKHWLHHKYPGTSRDPDFHEGNNFLFIWYFQFMKHYWNWKRIFFLVMIFHAMHYFLHIPELNLILFWITPSILSSFQLFYFGTFLPHHEPAGGYVNRHRATSTNFNVILSFITCYHFGYHEEHHEYPNTPWWQLTKLRQRSKVH